MRAAHAGLVARGCKRIALQRAQADRFAWPRPKELGVQQAEADEIVAIVPTTKNDVLGL